MLHWRLGKSLVCQLGALAHHLVALAKRGEGLSGTLEQHGEHMVGT